MRLVRSPDGHPGLSPAQVCLSPARSLGPAVQHFQREALGLSLCLSWRPVGQLVRGRDGQMQLSRRLVPTLASLPLLQPEPWALG